ncbi:ABC transporter ATP-binding protein [Chitinivorax sp. B]|uniref:ABC transporter ATP-binding protein n=1 Tax=Chitinivorax sp. B TaxID=2502235 RepID=UPI0010F9312D|nr:ABC transporter ATP-binding protein [Chitinivorax sp. B]
MTAAIRIQQISKRYQTLQALDQVSLDIHQGEFFALLGPNGAGKTTLITIMAGLTRADTGSIEVMGHNVVTDYRNARRNLGIVPQELVFDPFFTVRETLRIQSGYFGLKKNDDWIDEIMTNLDLMNKAEVNMRALSGGMKRRVLVAQALVHRPPVIVLDEPTAGVDVELRQSLWEFIKKLNQAGHTIVLTTHYLEEAETLCNRIAMLKQGRIIALDDKTNFLNGHATHQVRVKVFPDVLPASLQPLLAGQEEGYYRLKLPALDQLEMVLMTLREAGVNVKDIALEQPSLEDVFVQVMHKP